MEKPMFVHVLKASSYLINNTFNFLLGKRNTSLFLILIKLVNIIIHVLENKVEIALDQLNLLHLDDVLMLQFHKRFDFPKFSAFLEIIKLFNHYFYCYKLVCTQFNGFLYLTERASSNVGDNFIV